MQLSHVQGLTEPPLLELTIGAAFDKTCDTWPDQEAIICPTQSIRLNWSALRARVDNFASGLFTFGLNPGDRIGIWSLNRVEWAIAQFAAAKAGLILVTINPTYRSSEVELALNKVSCRALIIGSPFKSSNYAQIIGDLAPELSNSKPGTLQAARLPHLRLLVQMGEHILPGALSFDAVELTGLEAGIDRLHAERGRVEQRMR